MIIERIELAHVGLFNDTVVIGPLDTGLNVLSANNEAGKSTVVKAIARALFDRHTCKSEEIKGLQPLGSSLAPAITVDFARAKNTGLKNCFWNHRAGADQPVEQFRLATQSEGDAADSLVQQVLRTEQPGRGATKPEHWGLFQYLWARQGEPAVWPSWQGDAGKLVHSRLIKIELDPLVEMLKANLADVSGQIFTDQGRPRTRGPLDMAEKELAELSSLKTGLQQRKEALASSQTHYQDLNAQLTELEKEAQETRQAADVSAGQARQAELLLRELETRQGQLTATTDKLQA